MTEEQFKALTEEQQYNLTDDELLALTDKQLIQLPDGVIKRMYSLAHNRYQRVKAKKVRAGRARFTFDVPKEIGDVIAEHAKMYGIKKAQYIVTAVMYYLKNDGCEDFAELVNLINNPYIQVPTDDVDLEEED